jgi:hypothetical protein
MLFGYLDGVNNAQKNSCASRIPHISAGGVFKIGGHGE